MTAEWVDTSLRDLWDGEMVGVRVGSARLLVLNVGGHVCAYRDRCAHLGQPLSEGSFEAGRVRCRAHGWTYDARSGRGINPESTQLDAVPVRRDGHAICVYLDPNEQGRPRRD